jgi:hypothetical protein
MQGRLDGHSFLPAAKADSDLAEQKIGDEPDYRRNDDNDGPGEAGGRFAMRAKDGADQDGDFGKRQQPYEDHLDGPHDG